jgi:hypothetical protein
MLKRHLRLAAILPPAIFLTKQAFGAIKETAALQPASLPRNF